MGITQGKAIQEPTRCKRFPSNEILAVYVDYRYSLGSHACSLGSLCVLRGDGSKKDVGMLATYLTGARGDTVVFHLQLGVVG